MESLEIVESVEILNSEDLKCVGKIGIPGISGMLEILKFLGELESLEIVEYVEIFNSEHLKGVRKIWIPGICGSLDNLKVLGLTGVSWNCGICGNF